MSKEICEDCGKKEFTIYNADKGILCCAECGQFKEIATPFMVKTESVAEVPLQRGVKHPCQRMAGMTHETACESKEDTRAYKIIADREAYTLINVEVYLCPKCAGEMGV